MVVTNYEFEKGRPYVRERVVKISNESRKGVNGANASEMK